MFADILGNNWTGILAWPDSLDTTHTTTYWNPDSSIDNDVHISGDVTISANDTLVIDDSMTVHFVHNIDDMKGGIDTTRAELLVAGVLQNAGTFISPQYIHVGWCKKDSISVDSVLAVRFNVNATNDKNRWGKVWAKKVRGEAWTSLSYFLQSGADGALDTNLYTIATPWNYAETLWVRFEADTLDSLWIKNLEKVHVRANYYGDNHMAITPVWSGDSFLVRDRTTGDTLRNALVIPDSSNWSHKSPIFGNGHGWFKKTGADSLWSFLVMYPGYRPFRIMPCYTGSTRDANGLGWYGDLGFWCDFQINHDTVVVAPNTVMYFADSTDRAAAGANSNLSELRVYGSTAGLVMNGTAQDSIWMTSMRTSTLAGAWTGLYLYEPSALDMKYTSIRYARQGITNMSPLRQQFVSHSLIRDCSVRLLWVKWDTLGYFHCDSSAFDNCWDGIYLYQNKLHLYDVMFDSTDIQVSRCRDTVRNCTVTDNRNDSWHYHTISGQHGWTSHSTSDTLFLLYNEFNGAYILSDDSARVVSYDCNFNTISGGPYSLWTEKTKYWKIRKGYFNDNVYDNYYSRYDVYADAGGSGADSGGNCFGSYVSGYNLRRTTSVYTNFPAHGNQVYSKIGLWDTTGLWMSACSYTKQQPLVREANPERNIPQLFQNIPNPFDGKVILPFFLPTEGRATLEVYDLFGRLVKHEIVDATGPGYYNVTLQTAGWPPGCYGYLLRFGDHTITKTMTLAR